VWLVLAGWKRRELVPAALIVMLYVLVVVSSGPGGVSPEGAARVLMCAVPIFLVASLRKTELRWSQQLAVSVALAVPFQLLFNLYYWFT
jgi:hypothetical protein